MSNEMADGTSPVLNGINGSVAPRDQVDARSDNPPTGPLFTPKNIMVTGGAGFIASHVVILLVKKYPQYNVVNFDRLDYCACLANLDEIDNYPNYKFVKGNICSSDMVTYLLKEEAIDTILHFAAQTHVDNSFGNSFQFTHNNIYGTHVLLESAKKVGIKRFVHVSTDEVYGEGEHDQEPMFENHVLSPTNPYAATKAGAEFIAKAYFRSFNLPVVITRGNNVFGPHQYPEKLIPKFIIQLMRGRNLTIHGSGLNTRNFLYVTDVARAFDKVLHEAEAGHIYNIGGTNEVSVLQVAKDLMTIFGKDMKDSGGKLEFGEDRVFNDLRYTINSDKLVQLGWREEMSWMDGLRETVAWYKLHSGRFGDIEQSLVAHPRAGLGQHGDSEKG
ncbi:unnamed protein product [Discosporangium mesarthrocarpum]